MVEYSRDDTASITYKRCPYCYTNLKLNAELCLECKKKVGKVNKFGLARKPINYKAYLASILWIAVFVIYIWMVFIDRSFTEKKLKEEPVKQEESSGTT